MIKKLSLLLSFAILMTFTSQAQKVKVTSGKLKSISGHKSFKMEYSYEDGLKIGKKSEEDYVAEKIKSKNEKKAGEGDTWNKAWQENKTEGKFFDKMETLFNKVLAQYGVNGSRDNEDATCTIKVKVYYMDPGFNVGVARRSARLSTKISFVADGKVLAELNLTNAPGGGAAGYDFDAAYRLSESFEKTGKTLGKTLAKQIYK